MNTKVKTSVLFMALTLVILILFVLFLCVGVTFNSAVNAEAMASVSSTVAPLAYSFSENKAIVTGVDSDALNEFTDEQKNNLEIVIPATVNNIPVVGIGDMAFDQSDNSSEKAVRFNFLNLSGATNLKSIGNSAFASTEVVFDSLPKSLESIGRRAFYNCLVIDLIVIPDSVTHIGDEAFAEISSTAIETVYLPNNNSTQYGNNILDGIAGSRGETIVIAPSKELHATFSIQGHPLSQYRLTYETKVTFDAQNGGKTEETKLAGFPLNYAKYSNDVPIWQEETSYRLPTVSKGDHKFLGWLTNNESVTENTIVLDSPTYYAQYKLLEFKSEFVQGKGYIINGYTETYLNSLLNKNIFEIEIVIPTTYEDGINEENNVVEIGKSAFIFKEGAGYKYTALDLTKAIYLTTIGEKAFYGCKDLTGTLLFPDSITTIGIDAFVRCSGFKGSLSIPDSVTTIGKGAFFGCKGLDGTLKLPENTNFTTIEGLTFQDCIALTGELVIPDNVNTISENAFFNCLGFNKLTLPTNTQFKEIGNYAFQFCSGLKGVLTIPDTVNKINVNAFYDCLNLETIYLPNAQDLLWTKTSFGNITCPIIAYDKGQYEEYRKNTDMAALKNLTYTANVVFDANGGTLLGTSPQEKLCGFSLAYEKNSSTLAWSYNSEYNVPTAELSGYIFNGFFHSDENSQKISKDTLVIEEPTYKASYTKIALARIEVVVPPIKVKYTAFETFNSDSMVVKAYYNDNSEKIVSDYTIEYSKDNQSLRYGDTFVTIVYTDDGIMKSVQQAIEVEQVLVKVPTINGVYKYNGNLQQVILNDFYEDKMEVDNNTRTNAGTQNVTVSLKDKMNYKWLDKDSENIILEWTIEILRVEKPKENTSPFTYTGSSQTYHLESNNAYNITNNVQTNAGNYIVEVILKNDNNNINYEWVGGGHGTLTFTFFIDRASVEKPVITNTYTYSGSDITANVVTTDKYTVENNVKVDAGTYNIVVTLNKNYKWIDGGTESLNLQWIINKCVLTVIPQFNNQTEVYVGGSLPKLSSNFDNLGVISWDAYDLNAPATNKEFGWTWLPNNTKNYEEIKGKTMFKVLEVTFKEIVIEKSPNKTQYIAFELFDTTGMIVKAKYTDGTEKMIQDYTIEYATGMSILYGDTKVSIVYADQGQEKKAEVGITVSKVVLTKPTINGKYEYNSKPQQVILNDFYEDKMTATNNTRTNAGTHKVTVSLKDKMNYKWTDTESEDLTLMWEISCLKIEVPSPDLTVFVYDGAEKTYKIDGSIYYNVRGYKQTNAGKHDVIISLSDKKNTIWMNNTDNDIKYVFEIDKATYSIDDLTFNNRTVIENNESHTLTVNGLPQGITAVYTGTNGYTADGVKSAGVYEITVAFAVDDLINYNALDKTMTAVLTVNKARLVIEKSVGDKVIEIVSVDCKNGFAPDITIEGGYDLQDFDRLHTQMIYDFRLNNVNEINDLIYPLTIRMFISDEIKSMKNLRVYSVSEEGNLTEIEVAINGEYLILTVDSLSKFTIIGEKDLPIWIYISTAIIWGLNIIGACIILYLSIKKKKSRNDDKKKVEENNILTNLVAPILLVTASIPVGIIIAFIAGIVVLATEVGYLIYMLNKRNKGSHDLACDYIDEQSRAEFLQSLTDLDMEDMDEVAVGEDDDWAADWEDEDINGEEQLEKDNIMRFGGLLYRRSFLAKIIQGSEVNKRYYSILKNEFLSYKKTRSSMSITADSIYRKGERLAKFVVAGKTLKLYLALDPLSVEKNFFVRDESNKKKYEKTPCCLRVKSRRGMFKAIMLITRLMTEKGAVKNPKFVELDYVAAIPYEDTEHLIEKGLIKKIVLAGGDGNIKADVSKIIRDRQDIQNNNNEK